MSSRASSLPPSEPTGEMKESSTISWATAGFLFPPHTSLPTRAPISSPCERSESQHSPPMSGTSRIINHLPGFDEFAELVVSEQVAPKVTLTSTNKHLSPRISGARRPHSRSSISSGPNSTTTNPRLTWFEEDDGDRVTFVFGRFKPSDTRAF
ncbi:hypothetical protein RSOLAG1IB_11114 [Rhizoctonia solani AG-1 IB]|uniref:Uncharacterized protein n=1 Tax=Thanatephorus cucumeris (strain AG1-IB / isolate 7/3/14) TaxID=1108050 RepID=A0A0B7F5F4_THACB|nr:hypothetical protein RSOLAG1IB_11114 [Rhizoctonia solani AG-1 IB]